MAGPGRCVLDTLEARRYSFTGCDPESDRASAVRRPRRSVARGQTGWLGRPLERRAGRPGGERSALRARRLAARADRLAAAAGPPEPPGDDHGPAAPRALHGVRLQRLPQDERRPLRLAVLRRQGGRDQARRAPLRRDGPRRERARPSSVRPRAHGQPPADGRRHGLRLAVRPQLVRLDGHARLRPRRPALAPRSSLARASASRLDVATCFPDRGRRDRDLVRARLRADGRAPARLHPRRGARVVARPRSRAPALRPPAAEHAARRVVAPRAHDGAGRRDVRQRRLLDVPARLGARLQPMGRVALGLHEALHLELCRRRRPRSHCLRQTAGAPDLLRPLGRTSGSRRSCASRSGSIAGSSRCSA